MSKQYGLILPNKNKYEHKICPVSSVKPSIFDEDSDSDTPSTKPTGLSKGVKKQDKINQHKALEEDPTVFQYDEVYDDIEKKRNESKLARKDLERKPKYINKLIAAAEKRKKENERRIERQVQKEREQEGDLYKDKESFVTSAYKKKLEEMRELEEQEKREEYLESIGDVRKQGNLDGFYRHLFDQKVNYEEKNEVEIKKEIKEENSDNEHVQETKSDSNSDSESKTSSSRKRKHSENQSDKEPEKNIKKSIKQRKYRSRKSSSEKSDEDDIEENLKEKKEHLPSNLDADSDFSIDSSDSEDEKDKEVVVKVEEQTEDAKIEPSNDVDNVKTEETVKSETPAAVSEEVKIEEKVVKKPKVDIWKKRTVGEKFDEAVKRYFERKAQRDMLRSS